MIGPYSIHGYAIVSADDRIAGPDGRMPPELHSDADWIRFQAALGRAAVTVLGRLGHEQNRNALGRNRLVLSSSVRAVERRDDATWWNPRATPVQAALSIAAPVGGEVAVVGGRLVFDLFLEIGFDEFHLTRAAAVRIPHGVAVFSGIGDGRAAEEILAAHRLVPGEREWLDKDADVSLVVWTPGIRDQ